MGISVWGADDSKEDKKGYSRNAVTYGSIVIILIAGIIASLVTIMYVTFYEKKIAIVAVDTTQLVSRTSNGVSSTSAPISSELMVYTYNGKEYQFEKAFLRAIDTSKPFNLIVRTDKSPVNYPEVVGVEQSKPTTVDTLQAEIQKRNQAAKKGVAW